MATSASKPKPEDLVGLFSLKGKNAVVVGGAGGIGRGLALGSRATFGNTNVLRLGTGHLFGPSGDRHFQDAPLVRLRKKLLQ